MSNDACGLNCPDVCVPDCCAAAVCRPSGCMFADVLVYAYLKSRSHAVLRFAACAVLRIGTVKEPRARVVSKAKGRLSAMSAPAAEHVGITWHCGAPRVIAVLSFESDT